MFTTHNVFFMHKDIIAYNNKQKAVHKAICTRLAECIDAGLPESESKVWHANPVWFLNGNPVVGYSKQKAGLRLMFWSGADFGEELLNVKGGKFKDASIFFTDVDDINEKDVKRWLTKSREIQWDYKNIVKRKGRLEKIEPTGKPATAHAKSSVAPKSRSMTHDERFAKMVFGSVYPMYIAKVERKGRTKAELDTVITWLTGYSVKQLRELIAKKVSFETFFDSASLNPNAHLITGTICGYKIQDIKNPLTKKVRYLDKLVDELAKGRAMNKVLRSK